MERDGLTADAVGSLVIELPDDRCRLVDNRTMPNINVQHLVALTLADGGLSFASSHDHGRMTDPRIQALRDKITLIPNPELTTALPPRQVIISVRTTTGTELRHRTHAVKGTPDNPMTRREVIDKAIDLVGPVLGSEKGRKLVETVIGIERVEDLITTLRPLLKADKDTASYKASGSKGGATA
jgi:2-methylcitrate dehydratase PrpD